MELWPRPGNRATRRATARRRHASAPAPDRPPTRAKRVVATVVDSAVLTLTVGLPAGLGSAVLEPPLAVGGLMALCLGLNAGYWLTATALRGQTLGQWLVGIRTVRADTFGPPGWRMALAAIGRGRYGWRPTIEVDDRAWRRWHDGAG
jgi:uncharacterized RDD family membrane protein YckC